MVLSINRWIKIQHMRQSCYVVAYSSGNGGKGKHSVSHSTNNCFLFLHLFDIVLFVLQMRIFKPINTVCGRDAPGSDNALTNNLNAGLDS